MSIKFNQVIIHTLDLSMDMPVISKECLTLTDEVERFITKKIVSVFESVEACKGKFESQMSLIPDVTLYGMLRNCSKYKFKELSNMLANKFFNTMVNYSAIPSGDLIVADMERDGEKYLAVLKLNYKQEHTHYIENGENITIIEHKSTYINKVHEAAIINLGTLDVLMVDKSKERYLASLFEVATSLSVKEKIKVIEHVVSETIEENFENKIEAISHIKNSIAESIIDTGSIPISEILEEVFTDNKEVFESCKSKMQQFGLAEEVVEVGNAGAIERKYTMHKLKTNTGVELKFPTQMLQNEENIAFINNPDGTIEVRIKNIAQLINK